MGEGVISNELMGGKVIRSCASVIVARRMGLGKGEGGSVCVTVAERERVSFLLPTYQLMII